MKSYSLALNLFENNSQVETRLGKANLISTTIGNLVLTSGQLLVCDPTWLEDSKRISISLNPGVYPVIVNVAVYYKPLISEEDRRVANAIIRLNEEIPVIWKPLFSSQNQISSYNVDSGSACFMDYDVVPILAKEVHSWTFDDEPENYQHLGKLINEILDKEWSIIEFSAKKKANIVAFSSGFGDGNYPVFFGYSSNNTLVCILTDFLSVTF